jgi:hypothetical protein
VYTAIAGDNDAARAGVVTSNPKTTATGTVARDAGGTARRA